MNGPLFKGTELGTGYVTSGRGSPGEVKRVAGRPAPDARTSVACKYTCARRLRALKKGQGHCIGTIATPVGAPCDESWRGHGVDVDGKLL